nr:S-RNase 14 [Solanum tuberosum]
MIKLQLMPVFLIMLFALSAVYANFDYMQLVLQWPPTFCKINHCKRTPLNFTIHGLWPDNEKFMLNNCKGKKYSSIEIPLEQKKLDARWPDLKNTEEFSLEEQPFWQYEYNKHGTCCQTRYNQEQYFNLTMKLKDKFDLLSALQHHGINTGSTPTVKQIGTAIATVTKVYPSLKCIPINGNLKLLEIGICFNPEATNVIPCHRSWICHQDQNMVIEIPN